MVAVVVVLLLSILLSLLVLDRRLAAWPAGRGLLVSEAGGSWISPTSGIEDATEYEDELLPWLGRGASSERDE